MNRFFTVLLLVGTSCLTAFQSASAVTIDTVPVGNLGNAADPSTGNLYGSVSYDYRIGTTEVTVGQYTAFLNAVAATDTYALYNTNMATDLNIAGISRSGASGSYSYSVIGSANKPVTYVSWYDAIRFANWLHNGQGTGDTETGAYTILGFNDLSITRNAGATWFLPSENEWYKAAYYQPAQQGGDADNYWEYPMRTNSQPYSDQPPGATPDNTRVGNFYKDDGLANGYDDGFAVTGSTSSSASQNYLTDAGAYTSATSPYGTYDQGGNVIEWNEARISPAYRGLRGGAWIANADYLHSSLGSSGDPPIEVRNIGFRVATVPEPNTAVLAILACGLGWALRKRFK